MKKKKRQWKYLQGGPRYRNWMTLVSWVWRSIRQQSHRIVKFFTVSGIFSGKAESVTLVGFECTVNLQNLINFDGAIFDKIENFNFFLCELPIILSVGRKQKYAQENLIYRIWMRLISWFMLYVRRMRKNKKNIFTAQGFFREKPIVSYC